MANAWSPLPPDPPPVASSRGLSATEPGEAGAATEEGDPPPRSWFGGEGGVSNNMLHGGVGRSVLWCSFLFFVKCSKFRFV